MEGGALGSSEAGETTTTTTSGSGGATNLWDFLRDGVRGFLVLAALVYLTVFLVRHYSDVKDATTVLGVVIPVLSAALGAAIGAAAGNATGKAGKDDAVKQERKNLAAKLRPKVTRARQHVSQNISRPVKTLFESPQGTSDYVLRELSDVQPERLNVNALDDAEQSLAELDGMLEGFEKA